MVEGHPAAAQNGYPVALATCTGISQPNGDSYRTFACRIEVGDPARSTESLNLQTTGPRTFTVTGLRPIS